MESWNACGFSGVLPAMTFMSVNACASEACPQDNVGCNHHQPIPTPGLSINADVMARLMGPEDPLHVPLCRPLLTPFECWPFACRTMRGQSTLWTSRTACTRTSAGAQLTGQFEFISLYFILTPASDGTGLCVRKAPRGCAKPHVQGRVWLQLHLSRPDEHLRQV
jgi:hypothetical protein